MIKVLALPRHGRLGASSRLRMAQYYPNLESLGFCFDELSILGDQYIIGLYQNKIPLFHVFHSYVKRFFALFKTRQYDIIWLEKEIFPWLPAWLELLFIPRTTRFVVDYDDAVFHRYDNHPSKLVRFFLEKKIDSVMRRADLVVAGNEYIAQRARMAGCGRVEIVPTVIDLNLYESFTYINTSSSTGIIGWMGSPSTAPYLKLVTSSAQNIIEQFGANIQFIAIGAQPGQVVNTPFKSAPWAEEVEVSMLQSFDIGIMPLPDEPFERGKCGFKLIQYMGVGIPVIASPVGVNKEIIQHGVNGFLAETEEEWADALEILIKSPTLRKQMGLAGLELVRQKYCLQITTPRIAKLLLGY